MDKLTQFLYEISYKFDKGYPDINNPKDYELVVSLLKEQEFFNDDIKPKKEKNEGYHVGNLQYPAETLESRNWFFGSKVGYLGSGYYFYGSFELAMQNYIEKNHELRGDNLIKVDLTPYTLFKPENSVKFYDDIKSMTRNLGLVAKDLPEGFLNTAEFAESVEEYYEILHDENKINVSLEQVDQAMKSFIKDVEEKNNGTMFSNRILEPLGFEGIDNRNTELDNHGVGSVLFVLKN